MYYVPTALQATPAGEIEIVSFEQVVEETPAAPDEPEPPPVPARKPKSVKARAGDTLYSIAAAHKVKVYELARHNRIGSPYLVKVGQTLEIPDDAAEPAPALKPATPIITNLDSSKSFIEEPKVDFVTVKKGDTIYSIAKNNGVPLKDVILRNNMSPPYTLSIGGKIYMPSTAFHIVQKQDTLYSISRKYGVNLNSLARLNGITEPYTLAIGQKITLPAATAETPPRQKVIVAKPESRPKVVELKKPEPAKPAPMADEVEIVRETQARKEIERVIVKPEPLSSKRFMWPVGGKVISEFGAKAGGKRNDGINIQATLGTRVAAAENGIVAYAGNELKGLGNLVILRHDRDYMTIYAHNDAISVRQGDKVARGDAIATVGKTGRVTTPQLHFEIRQKTGSINPIALLERR
jgi:murein DD-endopeptidase MepM/ murein hydrolase activator NlpD